jgi:hypothetical protein
MGTTEQWVAAPDYAGPLIERGGATLLQVPRGTEGWEVWKLPFEADVGRFEERALRLVGDASTSMLFVWIQDSDFAAILGVDVGEVHRAVLRVGAAGDYLEGRQFLDRLDPTELDSLDGIANWSNTGPRPVEARDLNRALDAHSPVVDEEVVALLDVLGIAVMEAPHTAATELVLPIEGKAMVAGREVDLSKLSFFLGIGRDADGNSFVGIWKRGDQTQPPERFPAGDYSSAHARLLQLSEIDNGRLG